eukprot:6687185-Pyramimonas_sp.AAC.1
MRVYSHDGPIGRSVRGNIQTTRARVFFPDLYSGDRATWRPLVGPGRVDKTRRKTILASRGSSPYTWSLYGVMPVWSPTLCLHTWSLYGAMSVWSPTSCRDRMCAIYYCVLRRHPLGEGGRRVELVSPPVELGVGSLEPLPLLTQGFLLPAPEHAPRDHAHAHALPELGQGHLAAVLCTGINWRIVSAYEPKIMLTNSPA